MRVGDILHRASVNVAESVSVATTYATGGTIIARNVNLEGWTNLVQIATAILGMLAMLLISIYFKRRREKREEEIQALTKNLLKHGVVPIALPIPTANSDGDGDDD